MPAPLPPVDTNVEIPPTVKRASEAADAIHRQVYGQPVPDPAQPAPPPADAPIQLDPPAAPPADAPSSSPAPQPPPPPADETAVPTRDELRDSDWARRYNSMKGRYDQSQQTIGGMQELLSNLGDELVRTQQALALARSAPVHQQPQPQQRPAPVARNVSDQDVQTYGPELIEFVTRAARDAVAPDLQQVTQQVRQTNQKVTQNAQQGLYLALDDEVPNWREVNVNPRFKLWCRSPDVYSGEVRGKLLNTAFQAADAPRVVAFFKGFLNEERATGQAPAPPLQPQPPAAARQPAIPLDTLAAPGRAKPATGDSSGGAAEKPVFTHDQIRQFYVNVRRGLYAGRDEDKARDEAAIFVAQREGRVR